jgi:hypothetical protein
MHLLKKETRTYHIFHTGEHKCQYKYIMKCVDNSNISVTELERFVFQLRWKKCKADSSWNFFLDLDAYALILLACFILMLLYYDICLSTSLRCNLLIKQAAKNPVKIPLPYLQVWFINFIIYFMSVGIISDYGLDCPGSIPDRGIVFFF